MARLFRKNFIEAQIDVPNEFCDKVYGGWDFAISSNAKKFKHEELQTQLTVSLEKDLLYVASKFISANIIVFT